MWKGIAVATLILAILAAAGLTFWVEAEAPFRVEHIAVGPAGKALILYHPSRDAQFSDQLTDALAQGFEARSLGVDRWTITSRTPALPTGYAVIAIVSNAFFWAPDQPTQRYLKRARLDDQNVIAIIAGGRATDRAEAILTKAIRAAGANLIAVRPLWTSRPNEPGTSAVVNRLVAMEIATRMARETRKQGAAEGGEPTDRMNGRGSRRILRTGRSLMKETSERTTS